MTEEIEVTFKNQYKVDVGKLPPTLIVVCILDGDTVFNMMEEAQCKNSEYKFTYKTDPKYGAYITSIGGVYEEPSQKHFWFFYDPPN